MANKGFSDSDSEESCHMQKFSDDTAIVGCIRDGQEREYRSLVEDFVQWCNINHLLLNTAKTKEMVVDFRRPKRALLPVSIEGVNVEVVSTYKYLGYNWTIYWTGQPTLTLSTRKDKAGCTS